MKQLIGVQIEGAIYRHLFMKTHYKRAHHYLPLGVDKMCSFHTFVCMFIRFLRTFLSLNTLEINILPWVY